MPNSPDFKQHKVETDIVSVLIQHASLLYYILVDSLIFLMDTAANCFAKTFAGKSLLLLACEESNKSRVEYLIRQGHDANFRGIDNKTALYYASRKGWFDVVVLLVQNGADPNIQTTSGETPLLIAAKYKFENIVQYLVRYSSNFECKDKKGWCVLHYASHNGWLDIVKLLVERGADINVRDSEGLTPLLLACRNFQKGTIRALVKLGADLNCGDEQNNTALHYVSKCGWLDEVKLLMVNGACLDIKNKEGLTPLCVAANTELLETRQIIQVLVNAVSNIDARDEHNMTILHHAAKWGCLGIVEAIVQRGAELDVKIVEPDGDTPLLLAAKNGHERVAFCLINAGADVKCCDTNKKTVLWYAISNGWFRVMQLLKVRGIDFNERMPSGEIPLLMAASKSKEQIVNFLIEYGVEINCSDEQGWTVLHYVARSKWRNVALDIIQRGGDVNAKTRNGRTPLHCACFFYARWMFENVHKLVHKSIEMVELLCYFGADIKAINSKGQSPSQIYFSKFYLDIDTPLKVRQYVWFDCIFKTGADCNAAEDGSDSLFQCFIHSRREDLIRLGIENGGYFEDGFDISTDEHHKLRESVLQDVSLCTKALINKYNNKDLPAVYELLGDRLPSIGGMKINNKSGVIEDIEKTVLRDIETKGYCNVPQVAPMALNMLSVKSILNSAQGGSWMHKG